ncbi:MAG: DUF971 domain-containing protein [Armatimonadetes bacterium]|nr:DUF971 domain-containing protein [Armatimonadota bacterium]
MAEPTFYIADIQLDTRQRTLTIEWGDGHRSGYPLGYLRRVCPCALCRDIRRQREEAGGLNLLNGPAATATDELTDLQPVGLYAMQPVWGDGHNAGIYSFEYLRAVCPCAECGRRWRDEGTLPEP